MELLLFLSHRITSYKGISLGCWVFNLVHEIFLLSVTIHINCSVSRCLSHGMCLYQVMMTLHFLNDVANDAESAQKFDHYVIFDSLKSKSTW